MSQHTPPVDSSPINLCSTQHGHDLDDAEVSGFLREETSDSADVSSMPNQDSLLSSLNEDRSAPLSVPENQHSHAGPSTRKQDDIGPRVTFAEHPETALETFPNGKYSRPLGAVLALTTILSRGPHPHLVASLP